MINCRIGTLTVISLLQAWLMWNFLTFYLSNVKDKSSGKQKPKPVATRKSTRTVQDRITKAKKKREERKSHYINCSVAEVTLNLDLDNLSYIKIFKNNLYLPP